MKQIGYLFTAGVTSTQMRPAQTLRGGKSLQSWDSFTTAIVFGEDLVRAQKTFEEWCKGTPEGEDPVQTEIKKIVAAQIVEQLLTESGGQELDWTEMSERALGLVPPIETEAAEESATGDMAEGYWVDVNQLVRQECACLDLESLKRGLPEDIRSGLNWSPDRKFLFLLSCLSTPSAKPEIIEEIEETDSDSDSGADEAQHLEGSSAALDEALARLPEIREKEAAALIEARNSAVAAWVWRRFAANTRLASNEILVSPCCQIFPAG
jgi:hypothetical protein